MKHSCLLLRGSHALNLSLKCSLPLRGHLTFSQKTIVPSLAHTLCHYAHCFTLVHYCTHISLAKQLPYCIIPYCVCLWIPGKGRGETCDHFLSSLYAQACHLNGPKNYLLNEWTKSYLKTGHQKPLETDHKVAEQLFEVPKILINTWQE